MLYCIPMRLIFDHIQVIFTTMIGVVTWPPFCLSLLSCTKRLPSNKANHSSENMIKIKGAFINNKAFGH